MESWRSLRCTRELGSDLQRLNTDAITFEREHDLVGNSEGELSYSNSTRLGVSQERRDSDVWHPQKVNSSRNANLGPHIGMAITSM